MSPRLAILVGQRFGRLVVLRSGGRDSIRNILWVCRCDCGCETNTSSRRLISGNTCSCGCLGRERRTIHGACQNGRTTSEYRSWRAMKSRCLWPGNQFFHRYGGRGVKVCDRWLVFANFLADMGPKPSPEYTIDRKDNDGNYEPSNCRWSCGLAQARNRSTNRLLTFGGETLLLSDWAERIGISRCGLVGRLRRHSADVAFTMRKQLRRKLTDGKWTATEPPVEVQT
ncbi:MAG: hypothetical protein FD189_1049 [Elusimicrobia bacterium]|nr:MAG: hypothetical protein FD189_1049 [Elusimicrobiota bacterium]